MVQKLTLRNCKSVEYSIITLVIFSKLARVADLVWGRERMYHS